MAAKKEADAVAVIKEACMADARRIAGEKGDAEEDLAQAKPFLEEAERAVESIKVKGAADTKLRMGTLLWDYVLATTLESDVL